MESVSAINQDGKKICLITTDHLSIFAQREATGTCMGDDGNEYVVIKWENGWDIPNIEVCELQEYKKRTSL